MPSERAGIIKILICDVCGQPHPESAFVETIEEHLCQWCAADLDGNDDAEWQDRFIENDYEVP